MTLNPTGGSTGECELGGVRRCAARQLERQHRAVLVCDRLAHADADHPDCLFSCRCLDRGLDSGLEVQDCLHCRLADFLLDLLGESSGVVVAETLTACGAVGLLEPLLLSGHLVDHHQQSGDIRDGHRSPYLGLTEAVRVELTRLGRGCGCDRTGCLHI